MSYKDEDDYDAINNHTFYLEYMDELISNWDGIDRFDELVDLFWSLEDNEIFCRFASIDKIANSDEEMFMFNQRKLPFIDYALRGLGHDHLILIYIPEITRKMVNRDDFVCTFSIVLLAHVSFSDYYLKYKEEKMILLSDIVLALTFFVEDFDKKRKLADFDVNFFRRLHHLYWENKNVKKI